jgi:large subunit ribosomal protein L21
MFAIIETGGKQYRVQRGDVIDVERVPVDDKGKKVEKVTFERVLMVHGDGGVTMGSPALNGAAVRGVVLHELRGPKVTIFKKKKRKGFRRKNGHRQDLLRVRIQDISL